MPRKSAIDIHPVTYEGQFWPYRDLLTLNCGLKISLAASEI